MASGEILHITLYRRAQDSGAETYINNDGRITGTLNLTSFDDVVTNDGTWITSGESDFDLGKDELRNAGLIRAGGTEGAADTATFANLERLLNAGTISMVDEARSGGSSISDSLLVDDFESEGGRLALDVALGAGPGSVADVLTVRGSTSCTTFIVVNETQAGPGQNEANDGRFLIKGFAGLHAFEVAAVVSGAQNVFFDTVASWVERQNQLRDWLRRQGVVGRVI